MKAVTTKEITGRAIETIPIGTEFEVVACHDTYSACRGLGINVIFKDEYELSDTGTKEGDG